MNAHKVKALREMGINPAALGCVMLDVEPLPVADVLPAEWLYTSPNPERFWIKGAEVQSHITLLYGLLQNANTIRSAVDEVLDGWEQGTPWINRIGSFPSTFDDEPYACIVGHIPAVPWLREAHARLSLLPHIDTFWDYKPHVILAYVHAEREQGAIGTLHEKLNPIALTPAGLNYGRQP